MTVAIALRFRAYRYPGEWRMRSSSQGRTLTRQVTAKARDEAVATAKCWAANRAARIPAPRPDRPDQADSTLGRLSHVPSHSRPRRLPLARPGQLSETGVRSSASGQPATPLGPHAK